MSVKERLNNAVHHSEGLARLYASLAVSRGRYDHKWMDEVLATFASDRAPSEINRLKKDIIYCQKRYGFAFSEYFLFGLETRPERERADFISWRVRKVIGQRLRRGQDIWQIHHDKFRTAQVYAKWFGRDVVEITGRESREAFDGFIKSHPRFIAKPRDGSKGEGVTLFDTERDGTPETLFEKLLSMAPVIVEELVVQVPEMAAFHPSSVNTLRAMTWCEDGKVTRLYTLFRMGRGGSLIDNASAGGIIAAVDPESGIVMTPGFTETGHERFDVHPDTGVTITGARIPKWRELCQTLEEVAAVLPDQKMTGWDLALTSKGWMLIEVNHNASFVGIQMTTGKGLRPLIEQVTGFEIRDGLVKSR